MLRQCGLSPIGTVMLVTAPASSAGGSHANFLWIGFSSVVSKVSCSPPLPQRKAPSPSIASRPVRSPEFPSSNACAAGGARCAGRRTSGGSVIKASRGAREAGERPGERRRRALRVRIRGEARGTAAHRVQAIGPILVHHEDFRSAIPVGIECDCCVAPVDVHTWVPETARGVIQRKVTSALIDEHVVHPIRHHEHIC